MADGGKTVGNDEAGLVLHQFPHGFLDFLLRPGIHVGRGLIQNQHIGIHEHGPGDGQHLLLAFGNVGAAGGNDRIIPLGQTADETVDTCRFGRGFHFLHGDVFLAVGDVLIDGAVEQPRLLQNHSVGTAEGRPRHLADFLPVHPDDTVIHVIKPHKQVDDGGLTGTRGSDDGHQRAGLCLHGQVFDDDFSRVVAELYMLQFHITGDVHQHFGIGGIGRLRLFVQQRKHTFRSRKSRLQFAKNAACFPDGTGKLPGILHESRNVTQHSSSGKIQNGTEDADHSLGDIVDKVHAGVNKTGTAFRRLTGHNGLLILLSEATDNLGFPAVGTGGFLAADHFLHVAIEHAESHAPLSEIRPHISGDIPGEQHRRRHRHAKHQKQLRQDSRHHDQCEHHGENTGENLQYVGSERGVHRIDIIRNDAEDIAGLPLIEIPHRQFLQFVEYVPPHFVRHPAAHRQDDFIHEVRQKTAE